jgi:hypothetical protein
MFPVDAKAFVFSREVQCSYGHNVNHVGGRPR